MPIRYKKYSSAQIFKTSSAFLEYRRFEARRAVVCSLSAYKEPKLPGTSSTGRTLYPSIPGAKYRLRKHGCVQKGKFRYFGLKSCGIFSFLFPPPLLFFFYSCSVFWCSEFTGPHFGRKCFGELKTYGIRRKKVQLVSGGFSSPFFG